jgi:hypothetical protein
MAAIPIPPIEGPKLFERIVREVLAGHKRAGDSKCNMHGWRRDYCPDRYVGRIEQVRGASDWSNVNRDSSIRRSDGRCILLVMESPHIDEYRDARNPWPANGETGKQLRAQVHKLAASVSLNGGDGLVLLNAINFQCSLGVPTRCFRDDVFIAAWQDETIAKKHFKERLRGWYRPELGDVIVNACTRGCSKSSSRSLRLMVEEAIATVEPDTSRRSRRCHPYGWFRSGAVSDVSRLP